MTFKIGDHVRAIVNPTCEITLKHGDTPIVGRIVDVVRGKETFYGIACSVEGGPIFVQENAIFPVSSTCSRGT